MGRFAGSFDFEPILERGAGVDQREEVGRVHGDASGLVGFDEPERHREPGGAGSAALVS